MAFTLCVSGAAVAKAGANANPNVVKDNVILNRFSDEAEGTVTALTRRDWVANPAAKISGALSDLASDMIAQKIIAYDMSGYLQLAEAQTMLDVLQDNINKNIKEIKDKDVQGLI